MWLKYSRAYFRPMHDHLFLKKTISNPFPIWRPASFRAPAANRHICRHSPSPMLFSQCSSSTPPNTPLPPLPNWPLPPLDAPHTSPSPSSHLLPPSVNRPTWRSFLQSWAAQIPHHKHEPHNPSTNHWHRRIFACDRRLPSRIGGSLLHPYHFLLGTNGERCRHYCPPPQPTLIRWRRATMTASPLSIAYVEERE